MQNQQWRDVIREGYTHPEIAPSTDPADAVMTAVGAVATHLRNSRAVRDFLIQAPKGADCPDSPIEELHKYVEMQKGQIDQSDPKLNLAFLNRYIRPVFRFEREEVQRAVFSCTNASFFDRTLCAFSATIGELHDDIWVRWFDQIVVPYEMLTAEEKERYCEAASAQLAPLFDYTVFDYDKKAGVITDRTTIAEAFPLEVSAIASHFQILSLDALQAGHHELSEYFTALVDAYLCRDIERLESRWAAVDRTWVRIPPTARLVPVHAMESGYEHPYCVSPEFRLEVRTDQSAKEIAERRAGTIEHARALGLSEPLVQCAKEHLGRTDVAVFCSVVRSGVALNFRYAGQAVPNRQDVLAEGSRIFMDAANNERMTEIYRETFEKYTTPETAAACAKHITPQTMQNHTIDHEFAHPVGRTPESDRAMGAKLMKNLEEGKASLLGVLADEWRSGGDPEYRMALVVPTVARLLRFMKKSMLENATAAPYVRENRAAAYTLFETGVISLTPNGLAVDIEKARSSLWFDALREFNRAVIDAYQSHDVSLLDHLTELYCDVNYEPVVAVIDMVNRE